MSRLRLRVGLLERQFYAIHFFNFLVVWNPSAMAANEASLDEVDDALVEEARDEALENLSPDEVTPMQVDLQEGTGPANVTTPVSTEDAVRPTVAGELLQESTVAQDSGSDTMCE